jgi:hypothetical protein
MSRENSLSPVSVVFRPSSPNLSFLKEALKVSNEHFNSSPTSDISFIESRSTLPQLSLFSKPPSINSSLDNSQSRPSTAAFRDTISRPTKKPSSSACKRDSQSRIDIYASSHLGPGYYGITDYYRPKSPVLYKETVVSHLIKQDSIPPPGAYNVIHNSTRILNH